MRQYACVSKAVSFSSSLNILSVCYPAFSVPPAAGQSQIEPTRALANRRKPRDSGISHGSRFARPSGRTWSNLRPLEYVLNPSGIFDFDAFWIFTKN